MQRIASLRPIRYLKATLTKSRLSVKPQMAQSSLLTGLSKFAKPYYVITDVKINYLPERGDRLLIS